MSNGNGKPWKYNRKFWRRTFEAAIGVTAGSIATTLANSGLGLMETDWRGILSNGGMSFLLVILYALAVFVSSLSLNVDKGELIPIVVKPRLVSILPITPCLSSP